MQTKTRQQIALEYGVRTKTFDKWLKDETLMKKGVGKEGTTPYPDYNLGGTLKEKKYIIF